MSSGTYDKLKGKVKKAEGAITGSHAKKAEGTYDELKGKAKEKLEQLGEDLKREIKHPVIDESEED